MKKRIYISGKIGHPIAPSTRQKFNCAAQQLSAAGLEPVNPFNNGLSDDDPWIEHLLRDLEILTTCHGIYLLGDWEESNGARIEHWLATKLELKITHQPQHMTFNQDQDAAG